MVAGFRSPSFRPPCIREATFRHRAAPVFVSLRPSTTVAAWQPGPAEPIRGKASIPPVSISTGSGAAIRRDLSGFAFARVHPCPKNRASPKVFARSRGVNRPLHPSFTSFGRGSAMSAVYATVCQRPCIHHLRPSATVAAWQPGPAAPVRGKASIPPGVVSTVSGASVRRDLPGFASACVHPCPENGASPTVFARSIGVTRPGFVPRRTGSRLCCSQIQQTAERSSHRPRSVGQRSLPKNVPSCDFQLNGLWPGRLRRLSR